MFILDRYFLHMINQSFKKLYFQSLQISLAAVEHRHAHNKKLLDNKIAFMRYIVNSMYEMVPGSCLFE